MALHTINGQLTKHIRSNSTGEIIGFEILDEDLVELADGRSWNPTHAVWGSGELPEVGSIVTVTGKDWYVKDSTYPAPSGMKTRRQWNLKTITNLEVRAHAKPEVEEVAQPVQAPNQNVEVPF